VVKTIVLTGASDGIGAAAAGDLVRQGHRLLLVGRSEEKMKAVAAATGVDEWFLADFERLDDVRRLADELRGACDRIDVLANNAGGMFDGPVRTDDGFERTFQVNHLAPFLLTHLLLDVLLANNAAVVNTSSVAARMFSGLDMDDLNDWDTFSATKAYGDAKLANVLFARGLHTRFHDQGLTAVAFHPGVVATSFATNTSHMLKYAYHTPIRTFFLSARRGGRNLTHFVDGTPGTTWVSGEFYGSNRRITRTADQAYDDDIVRKHWELSAQMLDLPGS